MSYSPAGPVTSSQGLVRTVHRFLETVGVGLFYIHPKTRTHQPITTVGYHARMVKFLSTEFVQKDPSFYTIETNPDTLMRWQDLPNFRSGMSVRSWFHPYGADEGISMIIQTPSNARGVLHVSIPANKFPECGVRMLEAMRPEFSSILSDLEHCSSLTSRERQILTLISNGYTNREISSNLNISVHTVNSHVEHIFYKLEVSSRAEAIARGLFQSKIT